MRRFTPLAFLFAACLAAPGCASPFCCGASVTPECAATPAPPTAVVFDEAAPATADAGRAAPAHPEILSAIALR